MRVENGACGMSKAKAKENQNGSENVEGKRENAPPPVCPLLECSSQQRCVQVKGNSRTPVVNHRRFMNPGVFLSLALSLFTFK